MRTPTHVVAAAVWLFTLISLAACNQAKSDTSSGALPPANVEADFDPNNFTVDHPELFSLATAAEHRGVTTLNATGTVQPDVSRAVPVVSLAAGRVVEIKARLGDLVKKGQLLLRVQSNDVSGAYQNYVKAQNDERLAHQQLDRAQLLYGKGAIAKSSLEQAQTGEDDAKADLSAAAEQLRLLGIDKQHPTGIVDVFAPISGIITEQ